MRTTVRVLNAAMHQWRVIPKGVIFDNGSQFKGQLLVPFGKNLSIPPIRSAVNHPPSIIHR
jgi:hypothetical protein